MTDDLVANIIGTVVFIVIVLIMMVDWDVIF